MKINPAAVSKKLRDSLFIVSTLLLLSPAVLAGDVEVRESSTTPEAIDKVLAGKETFNLAILKSGEIVDQAGRRFTAKTVREYLDTTKPEKKAAYIFWISDPSGVEVVKALAEPFGNYGITTVVVRPMNSAKESKPEAAETEKGEKTLILVGEENPKAITAKDKPPEMAGRPEYLRPGKLPRRVRYVFYPDAEVVAAAKKTVAMLLDPKRPELKLYAGDAMFIQSGAWSYLSDLPVLQQAKHFGAKIAIGSRTLELDGRMLSTSKEFTTAIDALRSLIAKDGGGSVRALSSLEMDLWWTFISIDIEEPVFVIQTAGGKYRFVVSFNKDHVFGFDELNYLASTMK